MSNQNIWYLDIKSFLASENIAEFYPNYTQSKTEQLNSLFRFSIYLAVLFYIYNKNVRVFIIPAFIAVYTYVSHKYIKTPAQTDNFRNQTRCPKSDLAASRPTTDNPFMNPNLITRDTPHTSPQAVLDAADCMQHAFSRTVFSDPQDLFNTNNASQRFYTVPSTTVPNRQDEFAKFLYGDMKSRKQILEY
jgi:hypothetical protein